MVEIEPSEAEVTAAVVTVVELIELGFGFGEISLKPVRVLIAVNSCAGGFEEVDEVNEVTGVSFSVVAVTDLVARVLDIDEDSDPEIGEITRDVEFNE